MRRNQCAWLAEHSLLAYQEPDIIRAISKDRGCTNIEVIDCDSVQCHVAGDSNKTVVAVRGTEAFNIYNWLTNVEIQRSRHMFGRVHTGFYRAAMTLWPRVFNAVRDFKAPRLYLTGHSLGGAVASIIAAEFLKREYSTTTLATFGSPRVGDYSFATHINNLMHVKRYVNCNDIVANVPLVGYEHIGPLHYFDRFSKLVKKPSCFYQSYDRMMSRMYWSEFGRGTLATRGIACHSILKYCELITNAEKRVV